MSMSRVEGQDIKTHEKWNTGAEVAPGAANDGVKRHCLSVAFDDTKMSNTFDETNCHEKS